MDSSDPFGGKYDRDPTPEEEAEFREFESKSKSSTGSSRPRNPHYAQSPESESERSDSFANGEQEPEKPWAQFLDEGACSSLDLSSMKIVPREAIFDDWCLVGDLGFIFAPRGLGKTWISMHLATAVQVVVVLLLLSSSYLLSPRDSFVTAPFMQALIGLRTQLR